MTSICSFRRFFAKILSVCILLAILQFESKGAGLVVSAKNDADTVKTVGVIDGKME